MNIMETFGLDLSKFTPEQVLELVATAKGGGRPAPDAIPDGKRLNKALPLETVTLASLADEAVPQMRWVVPGLIPARNVTDIAGDGGVGKTILALQLALAVASDTDLGWIGKRVTEVGAVVFLSCEEELDILHARYAKICAELGKDMRDVPDLHLIDMTIAASTDMVSDDRGRPVLTELYDRIEATVEKLDPALVILDTRADVFGANEISRVQVRFFVRALRRLCHLYDTTIILLSHPSLSGMNTGTGTSGSTAWNNSVRSRLYLEYWKNAKGEIDRRRRVLTSKKGNYRDGREDDEIALVMEDGVFLPDAVAQQGFNETVRDAAVEKSFLDMLNAFEANDRTVNDQSGPNYAPTKFADEGGGYSKKLYREAMARLFAAKKIRVSRPAKGERRPVKIVRCDDETVAEEG